MRRRDQPSLDEFGDLFAPSEAAEPILGKTVRAALLEWLTKIWAEEELREVGLTMRRRAMFSGPLGVGKTTLAHHLAARLGLPMIAVRPDRLIDKWVGSTGRNIGALFDAAAANEEPVVLFLDEFDAIAITRKAAQQGADEERNSFVNVLLQRVEAYTGFLIAATNFAEHVDSAIWRRFDIHIKLDLPGRFERERILQRYLDPYGLPADELRRLAESLDTASPALIRGLCEGLKRQLVIGPRVGWDMARDAVIARQLETLHPHPNAGKPRLWSLGTKDQAVRGLTWPLRRASDIATDAQTPDTTETTDNIVPLPTRRHSTNDEARA